MWSWIIRMLRNSTAARYEINKSRMVRLAEYSRDCLHALRADTGIQYSELTTAPRLSALVRRRPCPWFVKRPTERNELPSNQVLARKRRAAPVGKRQARPNHFPTYRIF